MEDMPIVLVLKAMGIQSDHEILLLVAGTDMVYQDTFSVNFEECAKLKIFTQQQALDYLGARAKKARMPMNAVNRRPPALEALETLANIVLAHVPVENLNFRPKALYLAFMTRRVLMCMTNPGLVDDRDYVGNKRLELYVIPLLVGPAAGLILIIGPKFSAGQLLSLLFEDLFKKLNNDMKMNIDKILKKPSRTEEFDASTLLATGANLITQGMNRAISTGNWSVKRFKMERAGVTHVLSRLSYISALGMMTRISSQFEKTRKVSGPRALQPSQFGLLCPSDTPEGEACGLVKNLALMTHITTDDEEEPIRKLVFALGAEDATLVSGYELYAPGAYIIFINGTVIGITRYPAKFLENFRKLRRTGKISEFISIFINQHHNGVHIATDGGRICRPLIIVENKRCKVTPRSLKVCESINLHPHC